MKRMAELFLRVIDKRDGVGEEKRRMLIGILVKYLSKYPYLLVEFKPALGHVFADYIEGYTHWGYADLDIAFGDLPRWITKDELTEFDIVTYGYGDQGRVYIRGQFTFHKNNDKINQLWRGCEFLSEMDIRFDKAMSGESKLTFESAEGCYSHVVLQRNDIKIKYASKAFTDAKDKSYLTTTATMSKSYLENEFGKFRHGMYLGTGQNGDRSVLYIEGEGGGDSTKKKKDEVLLDGSMALLTLPLNWFEKVEIAGSYADYNLPLQREIGPMTKVEKQRSKSSGTQGGGGGDGAVDDVHCMYWAPKKYQKELCTTGVNSDDTVFFLDGVLYKQKHEMIQLPGNIISRPIFHFQEWKRYYRRSQLSSLNHHQNHRSRQNKNVMFSSLSSPSSASSFVLGWVLTKEGAIPASMPPFLAADFDSDDDDTVVSKKAVSSSTLLAERISAWRRRRSSIGLNYHNDDDSSERYDLPTTLFCLRSSQKKFPPTPPTAACDSIVSWQDSNRVFILRSGIPGATATMNNNIDSSYASSVMSGGGHGDGARKHRRRWYRKKEKKDKNSSDEYVDDITLVLTLQISSYASDRPDVVNGLLHLAEENLRAWAGEQQKETLNSNAGFGRRLRHHPAVLLIHVSNANEEVIRMIYERFGERTMSPTTSKAPPGGGDNDHRHLEHCFVSVIVSTHREVVSRKALLNMANSVVTTRWTLSGIEIERGLILSTDISSFIDRAIELHAKVPGSVFVLPQFALKDDDEGIANSEFENSKRNNNNEQSTTTSSGSGTTTTMSMADLWKLTGSEWIKEKLFTTNLKSVDCIACSYDKNSDDKQYGSIEQEMLNEIETLWWDVTIAEVAKSKTKVNAKTMMTTDGSDEEQQREAARFSNDVGNAGGTDDDDDDDGNNGKFVTSITKKLEYLQLVLIQILSPEHQSTTLHNFGSSPVLLVDEFGPRNNVWTSDLVKEIEEFGGSRCYDVLKLCQLATLGYTIRLLPGAFVLSTPSSRDYTMGWRGGGDVGDGEASQHGNGGLCRANRFNPTIDEDEVKHFVDGNEDEKNKEKKKSGTSPCDGCFMLSDDIINSILKDEIGRIAKSTVLWHERDVVAASAAVVADAYAPAAN